MKPLDPLAAFLSRGEYDPRLTRTHLSLYLVLYFEGVERGTSGAVLLNRVLLMRRAKISSRATYHRVLRELHAYGYLEYQPSPDPAVGSYVRLRSL